jgi:FAD:protein FMN transferase
VVERVEHVMGMPVRAMVRDAYAPLAGLDGAFAWLRWVDSTFSTYDPGSEVSRWGRGELALREAHPLVRGVLARCEELREETGGTFDIRFRRGAPPDPSGYVKGWAVERAGALLAAAGARDFCLDAGGDVLARGGPWRIGIRHPRERGMLAGVLSLRDGAVATSGAYERGDHVLDPRTGRPPTGALSVTVIGPDLGTADAYATAAFALGADGPEWTAGLDGYDAMTIVRRDRRSGAAGPRGPSPGAIVPGDRRTRGARPRRATAGTVVSGDRVLMTRGFARRVAGRSLAASLDGAAAARAATGASLAAGLDQNANRSVTICRRGTPERVRIARIASVIAGGPHT